MSGGDVRREDQAEVPPIAADLTVEDIVQRFVALDYSTWQYTDDPHQATHLGPMAQDFRSAFGLGHYDPGQMDGVEYIEVVDHLGVHGVVLKHLLHSLKEMSQRVSDLERQLAEKSQAV